MAMVIGGKHFGEYTYEHWFDHEYGDENDLTTDKPETPTANPRPECIKAGDTRDKDGVQ